VINSDQLVTAIIEGIQEKKGEEITLIDLKKIQNSITDHFVIATGNSDTHIDSIAKSVEIEVEKKLNDSPWQSEGRTNREWILLDYGNVVVHIFKRETREKYNLESLWGDGQVINIKESKESV